MGYAEPTNQEGQMDTPGGRARDVVNRFVEALPMEPTAKQIRGVLYELVRDAIEEDRRDQDACFCCRLACRGDCRCNSRKDSAFKPES